jgi:hypothetical protein
MTKQSNKGSKAIWWLPVAPLVCCGGTALFLMVGGAGIAGVGVVRTSLGLLALGFIVILAALFWRRHRGGQ